MKYYLYILKSETTDKYYTGISQNPIKRLHYHNTLEKGFTSRYCPWQIVFVKEYDSKEIAATVEKKIKKWKSKKLIIRIA
ncbi:MAG: GIY-YIG nuclease family protein [Ignavibacteriaceae bacterium]|nr:GIY-YIG nuclease family protein [Ignavibacteriaceae bacterium]